MIGYIGLTTSYSNWLIPLCLLLGIGLSFLSYYRDKRFKEVSTAIKYLMPILRALTISIIALLLLQPVVNNISRKVEKPIIIIANDQSTSLTLNNDSLLLQNYQSGIEQIANQLVEKYDVKRYTFGSQVSEGFKSNYSQKETDVSSFLNEIEQRHQNRNVGALIIASDGLYNQGVNPLYNKNNFDFPIFTIALGDSTRNRDLRIVKVRNNKLAYLGNKFPLSVLIEANQAIGEKSVLSVSRNGKKLASQNITFNTNLQQESIDFLLDASEPGLQQYQLTLSELEGEKNKINNVRDVFIDVLDGRQNILLLSEGPHPDLGALQSSISTFENYQLENKLIKDFGGRVENYDLIVLNQLSQSSGYQSILKSINAAKIPTLSILGAKTSIPIFNRSSNNISIVGNLNRFNESQPYYFEGFSLFAVNDELKSQMNNYPPLLSPFGEYKTNKTLEHFTNQKIGVVKSNQPLIAFSNYEGLKSGYIFGEGIWKWRLYDYQKNESHQLFDELIGKMIQYLSVKEDKSKFRVKGRNSYSENEAITFGAELYNDSYELINTSEVKLSIFDENKKEYPYIFNQTSNSYSLNAGTFPVGNYTYTATTKLGSKKLFKKGAFKVLPIQIERTNTFANHKLLFQLSKKYNGKMYYPNQLEDIRDDILQNDTIKPLTYLEENPLEVIHIKWIFMLLLFLLSLEWFLRKRNGAY